MMKTSREHIRQLARRRQALDAIDGIHRELSAIEDDLLRFFESAEPELIRELIRRSEEEGRSYIELIEEVFGPRSGQNDKKN